MKRDFTTLCIFLEILMIIISGILIFNGCGINNSICNTGTDCNLGTDNDKNKELETRSVSFATWNTQTFFDSNTEGTEYKEFQNGKNWNEEKYIVRLKRISEVITSIDADILVLQEIENENVMHDISNEMAGNSWSSKKNYKYGCFMKKNDDAIGCCVFSRFPVISVKNHFLDIKSEKDHQPSMRPVSQVTIDVDGKLLTVFVNHWKSKSGGKKETELWRNWQEAVLCNNINKLFTQESHYHYCIAAGDFNRNIKDFVCDLDGNVILQDRFTNSEYSKDITGKNTWLINNCEYTTDTGSFYYKENWERIDNILFFGDISFSDFTIVNNGPWTNDQGIPVKYMYYNEKGYSDHLPIKCNVTF